MLMDGVSDVAHAAAAALTPSLNASSSNPWLLSPSHLASPPRSDSLALLFSPSLSFDEPTSLSSPFPPSVLASPLLSLPRASPSGSLPLLASPPLLLLSVLPGLWAFLVLSMLVSLLVAALMGHVVSAEEGDQRHGIQRGAHTVEGSLENGAAAANPATTRRHLSLLAEALRLVLTRSLGTAAAVALLFLVLYILCIALNTWLAVYVFASLEVPGLVTATAAVLVTVLQVVLLHLLTWFVVPVAAITGKGVWASLATSLRLLPAHLLPSLAVFVCARLLLLALGSIARFLLRLLVRAHRDGGTGMGRVALVHTPSPLAASHAWVVAVSFTHLFLSSILSTALMTLTLSLLTAMPALYVYFALGARLDARTGVVLEPQGQEEEAEEGGVRVR
ncbi:unnamed protein product [Closterium sp. Naga37s-1]|nr:unnamed protein product [Closterium sp. Naga37s-1]